MRNEKGFTVTELMIGMAIFAVMAISFSGLIRYAGRMTVDARVRAEAQEEVRQGLAKIEESLAHANEIIASSASLVEFVCDINRSPFYDENGDSDGDGIPNYRDTDRDADAFLLFPATAQWRTGFNLKDDDEDGDAQIDVKVRIYLSGNEIRRDMSVNGEAWGARETKIMSNVGSLSFAYFGNKANSLGKFIDLGDDGIASTGDNGESDGVITSTEMDMVQAPTGMGDANGLLDTQNERRFVTSIRVVVGSDKNQNGSNDYVVETDVYPALLPLKSQ